MRVQSLFDFDCDPLADQPGVIERQTEPQIFSVTDASHLLKTHIETGFHSIRIRGEISSFKRHSSGHSYFALKDNAAVMDAIAWRGTRLHIEPEDGLEVIATGRITTYPGRSKYQMIVEKMEAAGKGALMALLLERKDRLQKEGIFQNQRPLPPYPKRIGIVTSPTGAVIRDILHRLNDRYPTHVLLWPAQVQGPGSVEHVVAGIQGLNALPDHQRPDIIIVARGGGSLEDLWTFNEEPVVRAVFESRIPIISAIGHETDTTLCDFAADVRAPTPTAAAEIATPVISQLLSSLSTMKDTMYQSTLKRLRFDWVHLQGLIRGIPQPQYVLEDAMQRLDDMKDRQDRAMMTYLQTLGHRINRLHLKHPGEILMLHINRFENLTKRFSFSAKQWYHRQEMLLNTHINRLDQANYAKILDKGFSWVKAGDKLIDRAAHFPHKTEETSSITLYFADGHVHMTMGDVNITIDKK